MTKQPIWRLIHTKPRQEKTAAEHLARQNYHIYLPMLSKRKHKNKKQITTINPLFPRYLFIRLSAGVDDWGPIRSTIGVKDFVRFGAEPARVPNTLIDEIKAREEDDGLHYEIEPTFKNGDKIRITDGPLRGCDAIFKTHRGKDRIFILLDIIGKASQVEVDVNSIIKRE